ncbi:MAG TPA: ABC transporter permease [Phycisphaerae bacterium]|nr:ABC transporter permease [Phycisphaerae bacterium]
MNNSAKTFSARGSSLLHRFIPEIISIGMTILACIAATALVLTGLTIAGYSPLEVLQVWTHGALIGRFGIADSFTAACPLLLTGLAAGLAFRAGIFNIGGQGQFFLGALAAVALTTRWMPLQPQYLAIPIAIIGGALAGGIWALAAMALERYRSVPVVLSTILMNFVAFYLVQALLRGPLQAAGTSAAVSPNIDQAYWLPVLMKFTNLHLGVPLVFLLAILLSLVQSKSVFGFQTLVLGLNPSAAMLSGIPVSRRQFMVMFIAGSCAGLGGALQVLGVSHFLSTDIGDYGYAGIAVALLGRLNPLGIAAAAIFFGMLDTGSRHVEENLGLPHDAADMIKAVVIVLMLMITAYSFRRKLRVKQADLINEPTTQEVRA